MDGEIKPVSGGTKRVLALGFMVLCALFALVGFGMLVYIGVFNDGYTFIGH